MTKTPLEWAGGKGRFLEKIYKHFPQHTTFVDVFGGSGSVILGKNPAKVDVYNDLDRRLANFFQVLCDEKKTEELQRRLENTLYSRRVFDEAKDLQYNNLSDIDRAYYFFITNRQSFAGIGETWGYDRSGIKGNKYAMPVMNFHASIKRLKSVHNRLREIQIENLDFRDLIPRYDAPDTLFYLDPPYVQGERTSRIVYNHEMTKEDHVNLINLLLKIKGMAILSGYETEIYNPLLESGWRQSKFDCFARVAKNAQGFRTPRTECLWISPNCIKNQLQLQLF
jgi:DNA adenine methylase